MQAITAVNLDIAKSVLHEHDRHREPQLLQHYLLHQILSTHPALHSTVPTPLPRALFARRKI